jgi:hypothetical protein
MIAILLTAQIVKRRNTKFLILQIALLGLFLKNVYYLNTNYSIIPFDDGNWDYAVVRTFKEEGKISVISRTNSSGLMEWYSQWPLLHVFATLLSEISGIDPLYISMLVPAVISVLSFTFVFLIVDKSRQIFSLNPMTTSLALLLYVVAAESVFWPMQFVHQNIGILFITIIVFLVFKLSIQSDRKDLVLVILLVCSLAIAHSFTSFVAVGYLLLLYFILIIWNNIRRVRVSELSHFFLKKLATISLVSIVFLLVWNENYGIGVWVYVANSLNRFIGLVTGARPLEYLPTPVKYPSVLTPQWATILVILRDTLIYVPIIFGLFFVLLKIRNIRKYVLISSALSFGMIFVINNFAFRVEMFRVLVTAMPITVLLGGIAYSQLARSKGIKTNVLAFCIIILVISSFVGLWGHQFAPIHLYDPSIEPIAVGERYYDFMRVNSFFSTKIPINSYNTILSDDRNPLTYLISSRDYFKIKQLKLLDNSGVNSTGKTLICAFKGLFLYSYFARSYSTLETIEDANRVRLLLTQQLNEKTIIFDDGKYRFWVDG